MNPIELTSRNRKLPVAVVVTGAAGFIGSHLALRARERWNANVFGIDNFDDYYNPELKRETADLLRARGIRVLEEDLSSRVPSALPDSVDIVFHAAARPGIDSSTAFETYLTNNFVATEQLLNWSSSLSHLGLFVFLSTSSIYGLDASGAETTPPAPASYYGVTKLAAEQLCLARHRQAALPACSCRLFSVYGPRERPDKLVPRLLQSVYHGNPFPLYEGSESHVRSFTYIDDIVDGLIGVAEHGSKLAGRAFNLGSETTCTTRRLIEHVEMITGRRVEKHLLPARPGDQHCTSARIENARSAIDYRPSIELMEGLQKTIEWYESEIARSTKWGAARSQGSGLPSVRSEGLARGIL